MGALGVKRLEVEASGVRWPRVEILEDKLEEKGSSKVQ